MTNSVVTFAVNQNAKYGDFRVDKYLNGIWVNQRDCNWSKEQAIAIAKNYQTVADKGYMTMSDNF
jgi:hypothetical protein